MMITFFNSYLQSGYPKNQSKFLKKVTKRPPSEEGIDEEDDDRIESDSDSEGEEGGFIKV